MGRLVVVLPNMMAARMVMHGGVLSAFRDRSDLEAALVGGDARYREMVADSANLQWVPLAAPAPVDRVCRSPLDRAKALAHKVLLVASPVKPTFEALAFRFNHLNRFSSHRFKLGFPSAMKKREAQAGNFLDPRLGRPFPDSRLLFRVLRSFHYASWQAGDPGVEAFFESFRPDALAVVHVQNKTIMPWVLAARRRRVPVLGVIGSWDQPTTKGPVCLGIDAFAVQNNVMAEELAAFHDVPRSRITVTGWPQMDLYAGRPRRRGSVPRTIVLGANVARLGPHEPGIARHIAGRLADGAYGTPARLIVRSHPRDRAFLDRFAELRTFPDVELMDTADGTAEDLATLLARTDVLACSASTIGLDAIANDCCVVNIAFDGTLHRPREESIASWLEADHIKRCLATGGMALARSFEDLDRALATYLRAPQTDAAGRETLRQALLAPLDGGASRRLADFMTSRMAR